MGCGGSSPESFVSPSPPPPAAGATEIAITCHHRTSAYENQKFLKLPAGISKDALPPVFEKFLTPAAWRSICEFVEGKFPGADGSLIVNELATHYPSLQFFFSFNRSNENRSQNDRYTVVVDTASAVTVSIPADVPPGGEFTFTVPGSQSVIKVTAPTTKQEQMTVKVPREPPATPMTAAVVSVLVPPGVGQGQTFTFVHPDTKMEISVTVPASGLTQLPVTCR